MTVDRPRAHTAPSPVAGAIIPKGIRFREDRGTYQLRLKGTDLNGLPAHISRSFATLDEAVAVREEYLARDRKPDGWIRVADFYEWARPSLYDELEPRTVAAYERAWRLRIEPAFGRMRLAELTAADLRRAAASWEVTASTLADSRAMLARLMRLAVEKGLIERSPVEGVKFNGRKQRGDLVSRALTVEQARAFLDFVPDGPYRWFAMAHLFTGMRTGEVSALEVRDVDLLRGTITVSRTTKPGAGLRSGDTKGHKVRLVPIVPELEDAIGMATALKGPTERVFTGPGGGVIIAGNFLRALGGIDAVRQAIGRPDFVMHDLRHTFATLLLDGGAAVHDAKDVLGHSSLRVTDLYSTARAGAATKAGHIIHELFNGPALAQAAETTN